MSDVESANDKGVLVVVSKLKSYIREKSEMNTSGGVAGVISEMVRHLCDQAIERAKIDGRKTVMDRDFRMPLQAPMTSQPQTQHPHS